MASGMRLREMASSERPQERIEKLGPKALSDSELLAMLLRSGSQEMDVIHLAQKLLHEAGSLGALIRWSASDFQRLPGIGKVKSLQLLAIMEIARRVLSEDIEDVVILNNPELIYAKMRPICAGLEVEKFWTLCLNRKNHLLKCIEVTSGIANQSLVHPREVFREAIRVGALAVIMVHNHPSGDPAPSAADIQATKKMHEAAQILGIELLDHLIVGERHADPCKQGYYSFHDSGLI